MLSPTLKTTWRCILLVLIDMMVEWLTLPVRDRENRSPFIIPSRLNLETVLGMT